MKRAFCTYFDHRYLPRGLALIHSLRSHGSHDDIWVLCLSEECYRVLIDLALPGVHAITCSVLEEQYPDLLAAKANRSVIEYYFTCTPVLMCAVLDNDLSVEMVTYLDTDLYFFDTPQRIFDIIGDAPVALTTHNFNHRIKYLEKFGTYNVGWVSVRRNEAGLRCLGWWRDRCLEWCFDWVDEQGRFADQGYLNSFPSLVPGLCVLKHPGVNLAPWNVANYRIAWRDGGISIDGAPLIFFHFHGVKRELGYFYFNHHRIYRAPLGGVLRNVAYRAYVGELIKWQGVVDAQMSACPSTANTLVRGKELTMQGKLKSMARRLSHVLLCVLDLVSGRVILVMNGKVY